MVYNGSKEWGPIFKWVLKKGGTYMDMPVVQRKAKVAIILLRDRRHFIYLLRELFDEYMEFTTYSFEEGIQTYINCDLALVPSNLVLERARRYLLPGTPLIVIRRTLSRDAWQTLQKIPAQEKVLSVNTYFEMALQLISTVYELGIYRLKLIPFNNDRECKIVCVKGLYKSTSVLAY